MVCVDPPDIASLSDPSFSSTFSLTAAGTLSPNSFNCFSVWGVTSSRTISLTSPAKTPA
ncbi:hypothetical protein HanLR1_Chr10g0362611 [Helianthus annuus]|nr:hypothetical protein HanHA89_Chr10g0385071 [Helianthus annuus]KAJ0696900.1 hypothetical protein HanLR1_Chr10g0362611 [Helianthus annuus]